MRKLNSTIIIYFLYLGKTGIINLGKQGLFSLDKVRKVDTEPLFTLGHHHLSSLFCQHFYGRRRVGEEAMTKGQCCLGEMVSVSSCLTLPSRLLTRC